MSNITLNLVISLQPDPNSKPDHITIHPDHNLKPDLNPYLDHSPNLAKFCRSYLQNSRLLTQSQILASDASDLPWEIANISVITVIV